MKRFTDVAILMENDERVGFILQDLSNSEFISVTMDEFEQKVKDKQMCYLVYENEQIIPKLTEEERLYLGKAAKLSEDFVTFEDYLVNNMTVSKRLYDITKENDLIMGIFACPAKIPLIGAIAPLYLVGKEEKINKLLTSLDDKYTGFVNEAFNKMYLQMPLQSSDAIEAFIEQLQDVVFSTDALRRSQDVDITKVAKKVGGFSSIFSKNANVAVILKACDQFDKATDVTIEKYKQVSGSNGGSMSTMNLF